MLKSIGAEQSWPNRLLAGFLAGLFSVLMITAASLALSPLFEDDLNSILNVSPITINGPTSLCPGESLDFSFFMDILQEGTFDIDESVWKISPPETVVFSDSDRFGAAKPIIYIVKREWTIPDVYIDPVTGTNTQWEPGRYERQIFVTAIGRNIKSSIQVVPFEIKGGCRQ